MHGTFEHHISTIHEDMFILQVGNIFGPYESRLDRNEFQYTCEHKENPDS